MLKTIFLQLQLVWIGRLTLRACSFGVYISSGSRFLYLSLLYWLVVFDLGDAELVLLVYDSG